MQSCARGESRDSFLSCFTSPDRFARGLPMQQRRRRRQSRTISKRYICYSSASTVLARRTRYTFQTRGRCCRREQHKIASLYGGQVSNQRIPLSTIMTRHRFPIGRLFEAVGKTMQHQMHPSAMPRPRRWSLACIGLCVHGVAIVQRRRVASSWDLQKALHALLMSLLFRRAAHHCRAPLSNQPSWA
ncbi:hypothetical protein MRB53_039628 [Persea americana]|nr:hypothetical protein MRB53_039628 [Persea americana]